MQIIRKNPIILLIIINLLVGVFTFQDYGYSWDEPLFYEYADALQYAYSPQNWFAENFDLQNAFGASASDHANRGPAYIILVYPFVSILKNFLDNASAWHFVNFLTFQLGVYLFYRFASRFVGTGSALIATTLFATQPVLWGHSFINPKDIPFLVFFIGSMCFGFELVDDFVQNKKINFWKIFIAAFFMGIATSIRVLGPLAALLTSLYAVSYIKQTKFIELVKLFAIYGIVSLLICFVSWPYLWINPLQTFIQVFAFMSDNPTQLNVLFMGMNFEAGEMPRRYILTLLGYTQTEPLWILFVLGLIFAFWKSNRHKRMTFFIILLWFAIPFAYVLIRRPSMYDGYRHFLFILPPAFLFAGFAFEKLFEFLENQWMRLTCVTFILAFGIIPIIQLHPYQYSYYNNFIGGVGGAFRQYETEYWLTCYREAVLQLNESTNQEVNLFVRREPYIADYYANKFINIRDFRTEQSQMQSGDYYLVNTRSNEDLRFLRDVPAVITIERQGAQFCLIKQVP